MGSTWNQTIAGQCNAAVCALALFAVEGSPLSAQQLSQTFAEATEYGLTIHHSIDAKAGVPSSLSFAPMAETVWVFDDAPAIANGVAIDNNNVWAAWPLQPGISSLRMHSISGDGTPAFEFDSLAATAGIAAAKGADRAFFIEASPNLDEYWLHAFTSQSNGVPDWSFELPLPVPGIQVSARNVAASYDGSTVAAAILDLDTGDSTLYVFDADNGDLISTWSDPVGMWGVDLNDDGSRALVTHTNLASVVDTATGDVIFQTSGAGGASYYRISGDGNVIVVGGLVGFLHVYKFDGDSYQRVIDFTHPDGWRFGQAAIVSRDGSTVGVFTQEQSENTFLEGEILIFDVESGQILGSHAVSGSGSLQALATIPGSSDDGSVMAFGSWGTEFNDWPEVMVFNRNAELLAAINFPGSAFSVDVSADGRYVAAGAKAVHANTPGNGGRLELIELQPDAHPIPVLNALQPESAVAASESLMLTVNGSGFRETSVVRFSGAERPTTFIDTATLAAQIPASDLDTVGIFQVTVFTPGPGGGVSGPQNFMVEVGPSPIIEVEPGRVSVELEHGSSTTETLAIANLGENLLAWEVMEEARAGGHILRTAHGPALVRGDRVSVRGADVVETTITHSVSQEIRSPNTAACVDQDSGASKANHFLRVFKLTDFSIPVDFDVTEVTFGVQTLQSLVGAVPITVNLYTLDDEFIFDNLSLIGTATEELEPQDLTLVTILVTGAAPAGSTLVVEIEAPDLLGEALFLPGSNNLGETGLSYLAAAECEIDEPTRFADIGFPNVHLVMTVTGSTQIPDCGLPEWISVDPPAGAVPGGEHVTAEITFDASGVTPGEHEANLCIGSNDPVHRLIIVPVTLTVHAAPENGIFSDRFEK